jgi:hypothetical protein
MHKVHLQQFVANRKRSSMTRINWVPFPSKEEVLAIRAQYPRLIHPKPVRPWDNPELTRLENEKFEEKLQLLSTDRLPRLPVSTEAPPENRGWIHSFSEPDVLPAGEKDLFKTMMRMRRDMGFIPHGAFLEPDGSDDGEVEETEAPRG